jgi:hypothetical protein
LEPPDEVIRLYLLFKINKARKFVIWNIMEYFLSVSSVKYHILYSWCEMNGAGLFHL